MPTYEYTSGKRVWHSKVQSRRREQTFTLTLTLTPKIKKSMLRAAVTPVTARLHHDRLAIDCLTCWHDVGPTGVRYRTIMAYETGCLQAPRVAMFSTQDKTFASKKLGTTSTDNARVIEESLVSGKVAGGGGEGGRERYTASIDRETAMSKVPHVLSQ